MLAIDGERDDITGSKFTGDFTGNGDGSRTLLAGGEDVVTGDGVDGDGGFSAVTAVVEVGGAECPGVVGVCTILIQVTSSITEFVAGNANGSRTTTGRGEGGGVDLRIGAALLQRAELAADDGDVGIGEIAGTFTEGKGDDATGTGSQGGYRCSNGYGRCYGVDNEWLERYGGIRGGAARRRNNQFRCVGAIRQAGRLGKRPATIRCYGYRIFNAIDFNFGGAARWHFAR